MQAVRSTGSKIEKSLGRAMWATGLRYRKNDRSVFGKPDFTFRSLKIAVFVDSEFWHGKDWEVRKIKHISNKDFWIAKIERNIDRDRVVNQTLAHQGWEVLRFWGHDIQTRLEECLLTVEKAALRAKTNVDS